MRVLARTTSSAARVEVRTAPEPICAPGEALVEVHAFSINRGEHLRLPTMPDGWIGGWDLGGRVIEAARDGSGPPAGSRVIGLMPSYGGWAERAAVPTGQLAVLPDTLSLAEGVALVVPGVCAVRVVDLAGPLVGRRVLGTGSFHGGGLLILQLARMAGARMTVALIQDVPYRDLLIQLGADEIVVGCHGLKADGRRFDAILEAAGGQIAADGLGLIAAGGTVVVFGNQSAEPTSVMLDAFTVAQPTLRTFYMPASTTLIPAGRDLARLAALAAAGHIKSQIAHTMPFEDAADAVRALDSHDWAGKIILTLADGLERP